MTQYLVEEAALFALDVHDDRVRREALAVDDEAERAAERAAELREMAARQLRGGR